MRRTEGGGAPLPPPPHHEEGGDPATPEDHHHHDDDHYDDDHYDDDDHYYHHDHDEEGAEHHPHLHFPKRAGEGEAGGGGGGPLGDNMSKKNSNKKGRGVNRDTKRGRWLWRRTHNRKPFRAEKAALNQEEMEREDEDHKREQEKEDRDSNRRQGRTNALKSGSGVRDSRTTKGSHGSKSQSTGGNDHGHGQGNASHAPQERDEGEGKEEDRHDQGSSDAQGDDRDVASVSVWTKADNPLFVSRVTSAAEESGGGAALCTWLYNATLSFMWPPFNYLRIHVTYILTVNLIGGIILYLSQLGKESELTFINALYLATSALSQTGFSPVDFSRITITGQTIVAFIIIFGSAELLTTAPVVVRLYYFITRTRGRKLNQRSSLEYLALWQLLLIVPLYWLSVFGGAWLILGLYVTGDLSAREILRRNDDQNPAWWGFFHAVSAIGNAGMSTFRDSMLQWQHQHFVLIVISFVILLGNTTFPVVMRIIVWALYRQPFFFKKYRPVYAYLLAHPRRCFTHLFPAAETRYLFLVIVVLISVQVLFTLVLDWHSAAFAGLTPGEIITNSIFQTVSTRTAGFTSIDITQLGAGILWLIVAMMYISSSPVYITMRYTGVDEDIAGTSAEEGPANTLGAQATRVFVRHFFFLFAAIFAICIIEAVPLRYDPKFSVFAVIFEVVSAYGTVSLSLGYGTAPYSFSGAWNTLSKLVLILVMLMGRHRGLPDSIDKAITLSVSESDFVDAVGESDVEQHAGSPADGDLDLESLDLSWDSDHGSEKHFKDRKQSSEDEMEIEMQDLKMQDE